MKVLSDLDIPQCATWCERVNLIDTSGTLVSSFFKLIRLMRNYDVFISANIKLAQLYGLYRTFLPNQQKKHIILELMLDEPASSLVWKVKCWFQHLCFKSVDCIFVSASAEVLAYADRFDLPQNKFQFLPFHTNVIKPKMLMDSEGYIMCAGKTGRDYETLAKAVVDLDVRVVVVSDSYHVDGIDFPNNVEVFCDIPYQDYMKLLQKCGLVVVTLKKLVKSTGQVVFLEAMALGKPVVVTETTGSVDYIENGVTGTLVPPANPCALRAVIENYLANKEKFESMAGAAFKQVLERNSFTSYTSAIFDQIDFHS